MLSLRGYDNDKAAGRGKHPSINIGLIFVTVVHSILYTTCKSYHNGGFLLYIIHNQNVEEKSNTIFGEMASFFFFFFFF